MLGFATLVARWGQWLREAQKRACPSGGLLRGLLGCIVWFVAASASLLADNVSLRITLRPDANCTGNMIRLSDIADFQGSEAARQALEKVNFGPAPQLGRSLEVTKGDVQRQLQLRGMQVEAFHWGGAERCLVRRVNEVAPPPVSKTVFTSSQVTPMTVKAAQRNLETAIKTYLKLQDDQSSQWKIAIEVPESHLKVLSDRRAILGVGGGESPWEGEQTFVIQIKTPAGEEHLEVRAVIEFPQLIVATKRSMRSGELLEMEDLILLPFSGNARINLQDCFHDPSELVGKELRKAASTNQFMTRSDVGPPRVIDTGDIVEVEVLSGGVSVITAGKSLQGGGVGDTVQVEIIPHKKRLVAQVVSDRLVRVSTASVP
jgi:flagella basal body P-ring formation protein FlgA